MIIEAHVSHMSDIVADHVADTKTFVEQKQSRSYEEIIVGGGGCISLLPFLVKQEREQIVGFFFCFVFTRIG